MMSASKIALHGTVDLYNQFMRQVSENGSEGIDDVLVQRWEQHRIKINADSKNGLLDDQTLRGIYSIVHNVAVLSGGLARMDLTSKEEVAEVVRNLESMELNQGQGQVEFVGSSRSLRSSRTRTARSPPPPYTVLPANGSTTLPHPVAAGLRFSNLPLLRRWFYHHLASPYPCSYTKEAMSTITKTRREKVDSDLTNWRRRSGWTDVCERFCAGNRDYMKEVIERVIAGESVVLGEGRCQADEEEVKERIKDVWRYAIGEEEQAGDWVREMALTSAQSSPFARLAHPDPEVIAIDDAAAALALAAAGPSAPAAAEDRSLKRSRRGAPVNSRRNRSNVAGVNREDSEELVEVKDEANSDGGREEAAGDTDDEVELQVDVDSESKESESEEEEAPIRKGRRTVRKTKAKKNKSKGKGRSAPKNRKAAIPRSVKVNKKSYPFSHSAMPGPFRPFANTAGPSRARPRDDSDDEEESDAERSVTPPAIESLNLRNVSNTTNVSTISEFITPVPFSSAPLGRKASQAARNGKTGNGKRVASSSFQFDHDDEEEDDAKEKSKKGKKAAKTAGQSAPLTIDTASCSNSAPGSNSHAEQNAPAWSFRPSVFDAPTTTVPLTYPNDPGSSSSTLNPAQAFNSINPAQAFHPGNDYSAYRYAPAPADGTLITPYPYTAHQQPHAQIPAHHGVYAGATQAPPHLAYAAPAHHVQYATVNDPSMMYVPGHVIGTEQTHVPGPSPTETVSTTTSGQTYSSGAEVDGRYLAPAPAAHTSANGWTYAPVYQQGPMYRYPPQHQQPAHHAPHQRQQPHLMYPPGQVRVQNQGQPSPGRVIVPSMGEPMRQVIQALPREWEFAPVLEYQNESR